jgi:oligopeptide transport system substrate-binding protein
MDHGILRKRLSRRTMLGGIGGSVAAAILAACGSSKATDTPQSAATTAGNVTSPTTAAGSAVATRPVGSTAASSTAAVGSAVSPAGTTAVGTSTTGTTTGAAAYSPQGTKSPNAAGTQVYRVAASADPSTLDPAVAQYATDISFVHLLYDALYSYDDKGNLVPRAALEVPTMQNGGISSDGKTYTIKLRPGQKFSDGSPVTAKDYVYSAKRFLNPALASNYASYLSDIVGYDELNAEGNAKKSAAELQPLADKLGVVAKDDTTLVFTLTGPQPTFPQRLSLWGLIPLKQSVIEKGGADWWKDAKSHVTNGAWILDTFQSNQKLIFTPNPNYTGEKPFLARAEFPIIADAAQSFNAYQSGETDQLAVPTGNRQQVLSDPTFKDQIIRAPSLTTFTLKMNVKHAPFDNPAVRKAFATAMDRDAFITDVLKGIGKATTSFIAPGEPGYNGDIGAQYKFDATKAKKILSDAGIDPKSLTGVKFTFANVRSNPAIAQAVQEQMRKNLGVDIQLDPQESKAYTDLVSNKKNYQLAFGGWSADYPDPDNWLPELFGTKGGNNDYSYSNPQVDALFAQARTEQDNTKRLALYDQAQKTIIDTDCVVVPIYTNEVFAIHKPTVIGLVPNPMDANTIGDQHAFRGVQIVKK